MPDEASAHHVHADVRRLQSTSLTTLIERCCSMVDDPDRVERITRLEVDLGQLDPRDFETGFVDRLREKLPEALAASLDAHRRADPSATTLASAGERRSSSGAMQDVPVDRPLELLRHFMHSGTLPWWADPLTDEPVAEAVRHAIATCRGAFVTMLRQAMLSGTSGTNRSDDAAPMRGPMRGPLTRLVLALDDDALAAIVEGVAAEAGVVVKAHDVVDAVTVSATLDHLAPRRRRSIVWHSLLESTLTDVDHRPADVVQRTITHAARAARVSPDDRSSNALNDASPTSTPAPTSPPIHENQRNPDRHVAAANETVDGFGNSDRVETSSGGLALLATFLQRFVGRLGLVEVNRFVNPAAQHRAVGLLSFLATGNLVPVEYLTTVEKVLCGMAIDEVLDFGEPVTDAEADECSTLLLAMIEHAGVLGDLSIEGLRGTFLLRPGVISAEDGVWVMRVERRPFDVVLDRLPWSFDWVTLPWMHSAMRVEW